MDREALADWRGRATAAGSRLRSLAWPLAALVASLVFGNELVGRAAEGWRKTQAVMQLEEELQQLRTDHQQLAVRVRRLETPEGQKLEARRCDRVHPQERAIILQPVLPAQHASQQPTWSDRAREVRAQAAAALHRQWRIFVRWAFGVRLPPAEEPAPSGASLAVASPPG